MTEIKLSTGRLVWWRTNAAAGKRTNVEVHYGHLSSEKGIPIPLTNSERIEAAKFINAVLHPEGEVKGESHGSDPSAA